MNKKEILYLVAGLVLGMLIVHICYTMRGQVIEKTIVEENNTPAPADTTGLAQPGEHCGGNIRGALSCTVGYHCANASKPMMVGDVGGVCVKD